jgi:hypothetical protein
MRFRRNQDYSQAFELPAHVEANLRYRAKYKDKIKIMARIAKKARPRKPLTDEQKAKASIWHRKESLRRKPLHERPWWDALPEEHKNLFLNEFDPEKQTIHQFRTYLSSMNQPQKPPTENASYALTIEQVKEIREAFKEGVPGIANGRIGGYLAKKYGVSRQTINLIKNGKTYKKV